MKITNKVANLLWQAENIKQAIDPITKSYPQLEIEDAYEIQLINIKRKLSSGRKIQGHKVGLSSKAMQKMMNVSEPDYGHLLDNFFYKNDSVINLEDYFIPRVEVEIAFILGKALPAPGCTVKDVIEATEYVQPAIELIDSRIKNWNIKLIDTIADNASSAGVILGGEKTNPKSRSIRLIGANLEINGNIVDTGAMGGVLNNPALAVAWLANKVYQYGVSLEKGHVILPGSCTKAFDVNTGDHIIAHYDGLGKIEVRFL
ncbi:MAG: 2-keto-4-pentenoate hydratase [Candidatus Marinimicrobia bacterium]|nr:2-keto-4-pentenoate hydratase [Candidatus Neomarinimicrobiota bacterium]|tara:strand:+ start:3606 stop:4382 length:777 start_codon:yes stop_codon:yes gene_type:complete